MDWLWRVVVRRRPARPKPRRRLLFIPHRSKPRRSQTLHHRARTGVRPPCGQRAPDPPRGRLAQNPGQSSKSHASLPMVPLSHRMVRQRRSALAQADREFTPWMLMAREMSSIVATAPASPVAEDFEIAFAADGQTALTGGFSPSCAGRRARGRLLRNSRCGRLRSGRFPIFRAASGAVCFGFPAATFPGTGSRR